MTRSRDASTATPESSPQHTGLDPASLADDPDVDVAERVYPHADTDHCEADAAARTVVGCTRADGSLLLLVDRDADHAVLPHPTVDAGEDVRAVAREETAAVANVPVEIGDPVALRRVEHYETEDHDGVGDPDAFEPPADATPHNVTHHVVFAASVADGATAGDGDPGVDDPDWEADWFAAAPVDLADEHGDAAADIRRFLD